MNRNYPLFWLIVGMILSVCVASALPKVHLNQAWGGVVAAAITAAFALGGQWVNRNTTVDTKNIDDRGQFTRDLMLQVDNLNKRQEITDKMMDTMNRRQISWIRTFTILASELKLVADHVEGQQYELSREPLDVERVKRLLDRSCAGLAVMAQAIDEQYECLIEDPLLDRPKKEK